jgi:hypothetical protein
MLVLSIWGTPANSQCWSLLRSVTCFVYVQSSFTITQLPTSCLEMDWVVSDVTKHFTENLLQ